LARGRQPTTCGAGDEHAATTTYAHTPSRPTGLLLLLGWLHLFQTDVHEDLVGIAHAAGDLAVRNEHVGNDAHAVGIRNVGRRRQRGTTPTFELAALQHGEQALFPHL
jgi:hypothetical protein